MPHIAVVLGSLLDAILRIGYLPSIRISTEPERSHTHSGDGSYHPELRVNDYFPGSSGQGYHSEFDIFSLVPPQYNTPLGLYPPYYSTPPGSYPPQYSTPPGSSSSMAFGAYDFSYMFRTPHLQLKRMLIAVITSNMNVNP
ncbi:hypothetical protein PVK06_043177 [Gossypium arboreum]|uniref:Uncharacterized protein n=1 Tax=Gossypium arboreum TaxID=29729 RepID=A0ABR0MMV2_GOSAR|nr:hypothetical protein PVK06_043177 [Gossypium arboreum]